MRPGVKRDGEGTYRYYQQAPSYRTNRRYWHRVTRLMLTGLSSAIACEMAKGRLVCECRKPAAFLGIRRPLRHSLLLCSECAAKVDLELRIIGTGQHRIHVNDERVAILEQRLERLERRITP